LQGLIHKAFYGKPKPHGVDGFDRALARRDEHINERFKAAESTGKKT
jgi:hypothetical protein